MLPWSGFDPSGTPPVSRLSARASSVSTSDSAFSSCAHALGLPRLRRALSPRPCWNLTMSEVRDRVAAAEPGATGPRSARAGGRLQPTTRSSPGCCRRRRDRPARAAAVLRARDAPHRAPARPQHGSPATAAGSSAARSSCRPASGAPRSGCRPRSGRGTPRSSAAACRERWACSPASRSDHPREPHVYFPYIGVAPAAQGGGSARR